MLQAIGKKKLLFVIVGTGRCGTVYFAQLLNSIGIACSHERVFTNQGLSHAKLIMSEGGSDSEVARHSGLSSTRNIIAESSYMATPYLDHFILKDATIIHAVRNPLDVILSFNNKLQYFHKKPNAWERFILSHVSEISQQDTPLEKNCCYVLRWNRWIENLSHGRKYVRVRLEHDTDMLLDYLKMPMNMRPKLGVINSHEKWEKKMPPLRHPADRNAILVTKFASEIRALTKDYGYEI